MLTNVWAVEDDGNIVFLKLSLRADTREHEELGGLEDTFRDNGLIFSGQRYLLTSGRVNGDDTRADLGDGIDDEFLGVEARENGNVGSVEHVQEASLADTVVDCVHAVSQTGHLARVDVLSEGMSLAGPAFDESLTERRSLSDKLGVGDLERSTGANLGELSWVKFLVIMVGCGLLIFIR